MRAPRSLAGPPALALALALATAAALCAVGTGTAPRNLVTRNRSFVDPATGAVVQLGGTNVVMKGPPWLPAVEGDDVCSDRWFTNYTCYTFNEADARHITTTMGWNFVRLGVVWAGAQPTPEPVTVVTSSNTPHPPAPFCAAKKWGASLFPRA